MKYIANSPEEYIHQLPDERQDSFNKLRSTIVKHLPLGFEERMSYGMIGYVVPKSLYPAGYHCDPKLPLPFVNIASQKNFIALYHMGIYTDPELLQWFQTEYAQQCKYKLDMGKSCVRFKRMDDIPFDLIAELMGEMTPEDWINRYESAFK
ncbi:MAG: DUF1801 domain-containing protein [Bacteroidia bacterium]|nr:DUF1801 domain-containing protein [Bacteroidia bacterium]